MKTKNHTPGPWEVIGNNVYSRAGWQDIPIATPCINSGIKQSKANANLIAAAPDLLSALIALEKASREVLDTSATHEGLKNCKILVEARIAIEKAGGEWK